MRFAPHRLEAIATPFRSQGPAMDGRAKLSEVTARPTWPWKAWAALAIAIGAALRLYALDAMEFKGDERESLWLAQQLIAEHPWSSSAPWPAYGLISSNGVGNAPLFTWIIAALWAVTRHPVWLTTAIAVLNVVTLYPLWCWARRRMDEFRALMTLAIVAFSPFFILFSRKIWAPDFMLAALLLVLWAVEWWRSGRVWRAVALLLLAALVVGQLHQSGPIALALLPVAFGAQSLVDRYRARRLQPWTKPTTMEIMAIAVILLLNVFFWWPHLQYLLTLPVETLGRRPKSDSMFPEMLRKMALQIVPTDLFYFFDPHRFQFIYGDWRRWSYTAATYTGAPLLIYGMWRWIRAPFSLPVVGVWWLSIVAAFAFARILTHPHYLMILAPLTALIASGGFDSPTLHPWARRGLGAVRIAYVLALLGLSASMLTWLVDRGGAAGEYGVAYSIRESQARYLASGVWRSESSTFPTKCAGVPLEVRWLADWMAPSRVQNDDSVVLCEDWVERDNDDLVYRWRLAEKASVAEARR